MTYFSCIFSFNKNKKKHTQKIILKLQLKPTTVESFQCFDYHESSLYRGWFKPHMAYGMDMIVMVSRSKGGKFESTKVA